MRSLRRTLPVRFSVTMFAALLLIGGAASHLSRVALRRQLDRGITAAIELESAMLDAGYPLVSRYTWGDYDRFVQDVNRFVILRDASGAIVAANTPLATQLPWDETSFRHAAAGDRRLVTERSEAGRVRALYVPAPVGVNGSAAVLQVAAALGPIERTEALIFLFAFGTTLLATGLTAVGSSWLARSVAAPVAEITAQADAITSGTIDRRIAAHASTAEYHGLVRVLNQMLDRLDAALATARRVLADAGHDLRTPLTAMRGEIEIALRSRRTESEYQGVLASLLEEVDRLSGMGEAMVRLARLESGHERPVLEATDVVTITRDRIRVAQARAGDRTFGLDAATPSSAIARADEGQLGLALDQLFDNVIRHTPAGTRVCVAVREEPTAVTITVADDGPGIPAESLSQLFDPFYRADAARQRTAGAGLGLCYAAAVARTHGGSVRAERSQAGGLAVVMTLPRAQPESASMT